MRIRSCKAAAVLTAVLAGSGCASGSVGGGGGSAGAGDVLTYEQLVESGQSTVYDAIQRLEARWLRPRGQTSASGGTVVTVFVDGSPRGDVSVLRSMRIEEVGSVTYLSASEAAFQFGTIAGNGGSLMIRTRR